MLCQVPNHYSFSKISWLFLIIWSSNGILIIWTRFNSDSNFIKLGWISTFMVYILLTRSMIVFSFIFERFYSFLHFWPIFSHLFLNIFFIIMNKNFPFSNLIFQYGERLLILYIYPIPLNPNFHVLLIILIVVLVESLEFCKGTVIESLSLLYSCWLFYLPVLLHQLALVKYCSVVTVIEVTPNFSIF